MPSSSFTLVLTALALVLASCSRDKGFDPQHVAVGPGGLVGNGPPLTDGDFAGGNDVLPAARQAPLPDDSRPPDCDGQCVAYCNAATLHNPVNRGLCRCPPPRRPSPRAPATGTPR
jgi:hypothetical protein